MSLRTKDQRLLPPGTTEVDCMEAYLEIAGKYKLKTTLFLTGKAVKEEGAKIRKLLSPGLTEVGGHTYSAFRPRLIYGAASRLLGLSNGPRSVQKRDIRLTVRIISEKLGIRIRSWRDHSYRHDKNTYPLLHENGIEFVSDEVQPLRTEFPDYMDGVYSIPINTTPDHENLSHSEFEPALSAEEWLDKIIQQAEHILARKGLAVILAHPSCMFIEDRLKTFEKLCKLLRGKPNCYLSEGVSVIS
jgi:peptidoglycan/xylan/chitin deacetylase (PgdA/CDA1 family)